MASDMKNKLAALKWMLPQPNDKKIPRKAEPNIKRTKRRIVLNDIQVYLEYNFTKKDLEASK